MSDTASLILFISIVSVIGLAMWGVTRGARRLGEKVEKECQLEAEAAISRLNIPKNRKLKYRGKFTIYGDEYYEWEDAVDPDYRVAVRTTEFWK